VNTTNKTKITYLLTNPIILVSYIISKPRIYILTSKFKCTFNDFDLYKFMLKDCSPMWYDCCQYIYALIREYKPEVIVETGINSGFSSYFILKALQDNKIGKLYSIDPDKIIKKTGREIGWFVPNELRDRWEIIYGLSCDQLIPLLDKLGSIDMFLHDSEHSYKNMLFEYNTTWKYLKSGGMLLSDDVFYSLAFKKFVSNKYSNVYYFRLGVVRKA
jgi:predicted O-methyltransferase YrrM